MRTFVPDQRPLFTFVWCAGSSLLVDLTNFWTLGEVERRGKGKGARKGDGKNGSRPCSEEN